MKTITSVAIALLLITSCSQGPKEKWKNFIGNFPKLELPLEMKQGELGEEYNFEPIQFEYLDLLTDTTERFISYAGNTYFEKMYSYVGVVSIPDKTFDLLFIHEQDPIEEEGVPVSVNLYTITKEGGIIDSLNDVSGNYYSFEYTTYSNFTINTDLEINRTFFESVGVVQGAEEINFVEKNTSKYQITDDGQISLVENKEAETPKGSPELVEKFLKQFPSANYPYNVNDKVKIESKVLKLHGFDFLEFKFAEDILYEKYDENYNYEEMARSVVKFPSKKGYHIFMINIWEAGDNYYLYTLTKEGEIIDEVHLMGFSGIEGQTSSIESSIDMVDGTVVITKVYSYAETDYNTNKSTVKESISKFHINNDGEFVEQQNFEYKGEVLKYYEKPDNFHIHNDGLGTFKIGLKVSEIKERLASMSTKILWVDPEMGNLIALVNDNVHVKFDEYDYTVYKVEIYDKYTSEKGIGVGSTISEIKQAYTIKEVTIDEHDASPFYVIKLNEMPDVEFYISAIPPANYMELKDVDWMEKIGDDVKVTQISIQKR